MQKKEPFPITENERRLLQFIRELGYGRLELVIRDSMPIRAESVRQSVVFDLPQQK